MRKIEQASEYTQVIVDDQLTWYHDNKMTHEQNNKFVRGIVLACNHRNQPSFCPSDFGMDDIEGSCVIDGEPQCEKCARQACQKFFEEHGL